MKKYLFLTIVSAIILSCNRTPEALKVSINNAEKIMCSRPDSALRILKKINPHHIHDKETNAKYALILSKAYEKNKIQIKNDSLINIAVKYYEKQGPSVWKTLAYYYLGIVYKNRDSTNLAIKAMTKAENCVQIIGDNEIEAFIYKNIGDLYKKQHDFMESYLFYQKAILFFQKINDKGNEIYCIKSLANNCYKKKQYDESNKLYSEALKIAKGIGDTSNISEIRAKIANNFFYKGDTEKAKKEIFMIFKNKNPEIFQYPLLANIYLRENNTDSARYYALKYAEVFERDENIYEILKRIEETDGNYKKALEYFTKYDEITDSTVNLERLNSIKFLHEKYKNELILEENKNLKTSNIHIIIIVIISIICFLSVLAFLITQIRQMRLKRQDEINHCHEIIAQVQENSNKIKAEFARKLNGKDETEVLFRKIIDHAMEKLIELSEKAYMLEKNKNIFYKKIGEIMSLKSFDKGILADIQKIANSKFNGIIEYVKTQFPELNDDDLDLYSLICLDFSNEAINFVYGLKNNKSIYVKQHRLRKKMNIPPQVNIETFIKDTVRSLSVKNKQNQSTN